MTTEESDFNKYKELATWIHKESGARGVVLIIIGEVETENTDASVDVKASLEAGVNFEIPKLLKQIGNAWPREGGGPPKRQ